MLHDEPIPAGWSQRSEIKSDTREAYISKTNNGRFRASRLMKDGRCCKIRNFDNIVDACNWGNKVASNTEKCTRATNKMFHGKPIPAGWSPWYIIVNITQDAYIEKANNELFHAKRLTETGHDVATHDFDNVIDACNWANRVNHTNIKPVGANMYSIRDKICLEYTNDEASAHVGSARIIFVDNDVYLCGLDVHSDGRRHDLMFKYVAEKWMAVSDSGTKTRVGSVLRICLCRPWFIDHKMTASGSIVAIAKCQFRINIDRTNDAWDANRGAPGVGARAPVVDF